MTRQILRVVDVAHAGDFLLALQFSDGSNGVADLASHLTDILAPLRDPVVFAQAHREGSSVGWPGDIDVAAEFLYALAHRLPPPITGDDVARNELEVSLRELRQIAGKTQVEVAAGSGLAQSEVSRIEGRDDALVSTLRRYVEALGGELDLVARIGARSVVIRGFADLAEGHKAG